MYFISQWRWYYCYLAYKPWQRYAGLVLCFSLLTYGWYHYVYAYFESRIVTEQNEVLRLHNERINALQHQAEQHLVVERKRLLQEAVAHNQHNGTAQQSTEVLLEHIYKSGLVLLSYHAEQEKKKEWYSQSYIQCSMQGMMPQMIQLLSFIKQQRQLITLKDIRLIRAGMHDNFTMMCTFGIRTCA